VPAASATLARVPQGRGWSRARPERDQEGPEFRALGPALAESAAAAGGFACWARVSEAFHNGEGSESFWFCDSLQKASLGVSPGTGLGETPLRGVPGTSHPPCHPARDWRRRPASQPAHGIARSRSPSPGSARPSRPPDSVLGPGYARMPRPARFQCSMVLPRAGAGVPRAASVPGWGLWCCPCGAWQRQQGWPGAVALSPGISGRDLSPVASRCLAIALLRLQAGSGFPRRGGSCPRAGPGTAPAKPGEGKALQPRLRGWGADGGSSAGGAGWRGAPGEGERPFLLDALLSRC